MFHSLFIRSMERAMGLHTGTVKGMSRAPYRTQVLIHLVRLGADDRLSAKEAAKIERVQRFLDAADCAFEIDRARTGHYTLTDRGE
jgi:hypothetical protein